MFKKIVIASAISMGSISLANADIIGGNVDVAYWGAEPSGKYEVLGQSGNLEDDFGLEGDSSMFLSAAFEHPVPLIPNIKVGYSRVSQAGSGNLSEDFNGQSKGFSVDSEWDLTMVDGTLYYEILDNWVNIDAGLTIRNIESELSLESSLISNVQEVDAILPLVYARVQLDLPFTGWSLGTELNALSFDGNRIFDGNGYIQYETFEILHARAGYKTLDISVSESNDSIEGDISGLYVGIGIDF